MAKEIPQRMRQRMEGIIFPEGHHEAGAKTAFLG